MADKAVTTDGNWTNITTPAAADRLMITEAATGTLKDITPDVLMKVINVLTADTAPQLADAVTTYDASAAAAKQVAIYSLLSFLPDGTMLNGKISVTVASNNITVALKTQAGNDPSAADPVLAKINGTWRSCTAALSVTKNAGTQWFALGTPFAALEQNFFAYLIWNTTPATDIVDLGFARICSGRVYSDFSGTTTNERYLANSNASAPTSTDDVINIGRFAATLSAVASYNWSVPTFTNSNLIQRPCYETELCTFIPSPTGYSAVPTNTAYQYQLINKLVKIYLREGTDGTSNATTVTMTAPFTAVTLTNGLWAGFGSGVDNGAALTTTVRLAISSAGATISALPNGSFSSAWTNINAKRVVNGYLEYPIA